jgi:hypothetical protein
VFTKQLGPDFAKYVWENAAHEVGHTVSGGVRPGANGAAM